MANLRSATNWIGMLSDSCECFSSSTSEDELDDLPGAPADILAYTFFLRGTGFFFGDVGIGLGDKGEGLGRC